MIERTIAFVKESLKNAEAGHDWHHIQRVHRMAKEIGEKENADMLVVELAALLHDIADSKFHNGDEEIGPRTAVRFMTELGLDQNTIDHVEQIIRNISFKGGHKSGTFTSKELDVVQDADRLDAIGAIGIARTFNYGGFKNRALYDPEIAPNLNMTKEEYKNSTAPTINHFYEKLFLLKDLMNTASGKAMAKDRHAYMEEFVQRFMEEWHGKNG